MAIYWITGASSGIGLGLAQELSFQGHKVILSARNSEKLNEVKSTLAHPENAFVLPFDVTDFNSLESVTNMAFSAFGSIDTVVLNAGLSQRSLFKDSKFEIYRDLMEVNFFSNVQLTQKILPKFLDKNHGQFVVISSLVGKFGTPYRTGYSASKHALHGFYDSLRAELMMDDRNIHVTIICPGFVDTNVSFNALGNDGKPTHVRDESNAEGLKPREFAKKAITAIESKKFEAAIGGKEVLGVKLKRFLPDLFAKKIAKAKVR